MEIILLVVFPAIFFYILYGVIRAATRDGILAAKQAKETAQLLKPFRETVTRPFMSW
jgi:hypothetical protein